MRVFLLYSTNLLVYIYVSTHKYCERDLKCAFGESNLKYIKITKEFKLQTPHVECIFIRFMTRAPTSLWVTPKVGSRFGSPPRGFFVTVAKEM